MQSLSRIALHLFAFVLLIMGITVLCASAASIWSTPGVFTRVTLFPNNTHQYVISSVIAVEDARLIFDYEYTRYEGKFGSSRPELEFHAGLNFGKPLGGSFVNDGKWFLYKKNIWPTGLSINPLSTYIAQHTVLLPSLLAASALMIVSLWWLAPVVKRWFTRRIQTNLCLHCGYNLTGVESDKCPECGAERPLVTVSSQA